MAEKGNNRPTNDGNGGSGQSERYKQAATEALEMLDWSIGFLVGIRKGAIASQLARGTVELGSAKLGQAADRLEQHGLDCFHAQTFGS